MATIGFGFTWHDERFWVKMPTTIRSHSLLSYADTDADMDPLAALVFGLAIGID